jgi:hypothetical protein
MLASARGGEDELDAREPARLRTEAEASEYASLHGAP